MAANVSSNDSLLDLNLTSTESGACITAELKYVLYVIFYSTNTILLLPLCTFVVYLGVQRWRQQRSASSAAVTSHSDAFTYHLVAMELVGVFGSVLCCCGIYSHAGYVVITGYFLSSFTWYGESFFHIVICVEHYLAVVHPVTYRGLKGERGIRIRNVAIGCVWLLSVAETTMIALKDVTIYVSLWTLFISLVVIPFCSLSVLCALIRPGPGEQIGDRERVDQSKQRAFYTVSAILGVLLLRCVWNAVYFALILSRAVECSIASFESWINLPSSLMVPLLFLHRAGVFVCCKNPNSQN